jgi:hypothetical protein
LTGVAEKVTEVPAQIAPAGNAAILTLAGALGFTVTVMPLEVTGLPVAQDNVEVISTVITSPLARVDVV